MQLDNRGKIVIGVVSAVIAVGAMHFLIFSNNAKSYKNHRANYQQSLRQYQDQGSPKPKAEIYNFDFKTASYALDYWEMFDNINAALPAATEKLPANEEEAEFLYNTNQIMTYDTFLKEWLRRPESDGLASLSFLTSDQHWFLLNELPQSVVNGTTDISDKLRDLKDTYEIIDQSDEDSTLYYQKQPLYQEQLRQFGLDLRRREAMVDAFGEVSAMMYTLNRIDLVANAVPKEELGVFVDEEEYKLYLLKLFNYERYELEDILVYRKMEAFQKIMELADKNGISDISYVKIWKKKNMKWPPLEERTKEDPAAASGGFGGEYFDEESFMMGGMSEEEMMMMGGKAGGGRGNAAAAGNTVPAVDENKDAVAETTPIEITVVGSNTEVMSFLYELNNTQRYFYTDRLVIQALPQEDNLMQATVVIAVVSALFSDPLITNSEVKQNIEKFRANKNWLAMQQGVDVGDFQPDPNNAVSPAYQ